MDKIELIKEAIQKAENGQSKLTQEILDLPSYSSHKIKHLLNNLGEIGENYLEVGLHKAGTFIAANYKNNMFSYGFDNYSEFAENGLAKQLAYQFCNTHLTNKYSIIEDDIFDGSIFIFTSKFDFYLYDGNHADWAQKKALTCLYTCLSDEFIFCVDDYDWEAVQKGTQEGIKECGLEVLFEQHLTSDKEGDADNWWNGFYVALLKKKDI